MLQDGLRAMECLSPPAQPWAGITHLMDALCHSSGPAVPLWSWDRLGGWHMLTVHADRASTLAASGVLGMMFLVMLCVTSLLSEEAMGDSQSRQ